MGGWKCGVIRVTFRPSTPWRLRLNFLLSPSPAHNSKSPSRAIMSNDSQNPENHPDGKRAFQSSPPQDGKFFTDSSFTKVEKIGITALVSILVLTLTLTLIHFSNNIHIKSAIAEDLDLPIKGELVTVSSVETYWRAPVTEGENIDIVRRGVKFIPVIRLVIEGTSGDSAAIRIFFRDEKGAVVGDSISLPISNKGTMEITATDGFSDIGMYSAYRTGESPRWIIQVLEGQSVNASREKLHTLFETEISTNMH